MECNGVLGKFLNEPMHLQFKFAKRSHGKNSKDIHGNFPEIIFRETAAEISRWNAPGQPGIQ